MEFLIYGITGYTGQLVAARAAELGVTPIVAGRDEARTRELAERYGFKWRAFSLDDQAAVKHALQDVPLVLNLAGPFSATAKPMVDAAIATGTHYLDITGEVAVFEAMAARDKEAKAAGVMLMPGCGFDVVPSDCLAAHMKKRMPDAISLDLIITGLGKTSRGTAKTGIEGLRKSRQARRDGKIVSLERPVWKRVSFADGLEKDLVSVTWGDVSTAWYSTGIPDITVFFEDIGPIRQMARMGPVTRCLFSTRLGQAFLKAQVDKRPPGPTEEERRTGAGLMVGLARNKAGGQIRSQLITPDGYSLTAITTLEIAIRVIRGDFYPGFRTPSQQFGPDFILEFEGCIRSDIV